MVFKSQPQTEDEDVYDIVVIGAGPAGLMAATNMVRWGYRVLIVDDRSEATPAGRADGLHPRSVQVMDEMGFHDALWAHKPATCKSLNFWVGTGESLKLMASVPACPPEIDTRYPYVVNLHQGLFEGLFLSDMKRRGVMCQRPWSFKSYKFDEGDDDEYPVTVNIQNVDDPTKKRSVRAKYLFSGEGARSVARQQAGIKMEWRDSKASTYGVLDGEVDSDFPHIREACVLQGPSGSILLITRERPKLVRVYVPLDDESGVAGAEAASGPPSLEHVKEQTKRIFHPYTVKWDTVEWLSRYSVRQGIADSYSLGGRIFLGGDACHVHSPKMGQGMNLAYADALNLVWKIHAVESGVASRSLLETYETERRQAALDIIEFDYKYTAMFGQRLMGVIEKQMRGLERTKEDDTELANVFGRNGRMISGYGLTYPDDSLIKSWRADPSVTLANDDLRPGSCFTFTADVTRVRDGKVVQLEQEIGINGSFRIYIFAGDLERSLPALEQLSTQLRRPESFLHVDTQRPRRKSEAFTAEGLSAGQGSGLFTVCMAFVPSGRHDITNNDDNKYDDDLLLNVPTSLCISGNRIYADDQGGPIAHNKIGLGNGVGAVMVVRPDGYVALALQLQNSPATGEALNSYFTKLQNEVVA